MKTNRKVLQWFIAGILWMAALLQATNVQARYIYPVTASLQLIPPYSVYLPDYAAPGNDKLRVILTLNDLTQPSYTVRLRLKVEFNGKVIMQTDPAYRASPITILPGMPQIITGTQLNELLVSDHMQFMNGFNRENYERTKALPEGAYRICVTAYDYNRSDEVALSNDGCNIFFFQKNEAPLLNFPLCNTWVEKKEPQFLNFTWSIRNTPSFITGSLGTGYRFELFEVRPAGSNAEYIVRSSTPIYSVTTDAAMLTYGPAMPRLLDSMQYVWRVQAFDKSGRDAFQNNGYSQACVFTYGGIDPFVANNIGKADLSGDALGERSGKWWWHLNSAQTVNGWNIQYRKKGDSANKGAAYSWNKQFLTDTLFHLFNLEPDNPYEAQVQPVIKGINGFWSDLASIRTFPKRVYECGKNDTASNGLSAAAQPLNTAVAGMVIRVGSFDMQLLDVQGGNGRFTGYGAVATPLLGMRLNVKFTNVQINDRLQLTQGEVVALSDGIDAWIKDRTKVQDDVQTIKDWKETMPGFDTDSLATLKDFAAELLGISPGIWTDTYVFTEQERKDVMAAIQEVQAAMQELNDGDPSNDAAAEKNLRDGLNKAEPMLEKLSENIGKGVLVKLGLVRDKLVTDALTDVKKQVEEDLKKLVLRLDATQRASLAMHGPHQFGYKERESDKTKLEAKVKLIERLVADQQTRQLFQDRISRNNTDNSVLSEQENVLTPLLEKEENKSKNSKDLLNADSWGKVKGIMNKYLDGQVDAEQLLEGSADLMEDNNNQSSFKVPQDKVYYLTPDGRPLDLDYFPGVLLIESHGTAQLPYVVTGFTMAFHNDKIKWVARGKGGKFLGYVNTQDPADIFDLKDYLVEVSSCKVKLPYAIDQCYYKNLIGEKWEVPDGKTVPEVKELLAKFAAPYKTIDKSEALSLVTLNYDGVSIPTCVINNAGGNGSGGGAAPAVTVMAKSVKDLQTLVQKLSNIGLKIGNGGGYYFDRIIVNDENLTPEELKALNAAVDTDVKNRSNFRCLWITLDTAGEFKSVKTVYSKDVPKDVTVILDVFRDYVKHMAERRGWQKCLDVVSDALKQLADFIRKAKVPEKYYNPLDKEYDADNFVLFLFKGVTVASAYTGGIGPMLQLAPGIRGKMNEQVGIPEVDFAFYCGIWNGLIDQIAFLPETPSWLIDLITDKDNARTEFIIGVQKMNKEADSVGGFCNLLGTIIGKSFNGPNAALNAHSYGVATSQIITIVLSAAKIGQATKIANLLNKLDIVGNVMGVFLSPTIDLFGWATKVVIKATGKATIGIMKGSAEVAVAFLKGKAKFLNGKTCGIAIPLANNFMAGGEELVRQLSNLKVLKFLRDGEGNLLREEGTGAYIVMIEDDAGRTMHATTNEAPPAGDKDLSLTDKEGATTGDAPEPGKETPNKADDVADALEAALKKWEDYPKKRINGEEFAVIGERNYSREAFDAMTSEAGAAAGVTARKVESILQTRKGYTNGSKTYFDNISEIIVTEENNVIRGVYKITEKAPGTSAKVFERSPVKAKYQLKNSYKGADIEWEAAKARIVRGAEHNDGNYAFLSGEVDGMDIDIKDLWGSGIVHPSEPQLYEAIEVMGKTGEYAGKKYLRNTCSEYKGLNWLAKKLKPGATLEDVFEDVRGVLKIASENPYCPSCVGVIQQFNKMFPKIDLILINGTKVRP